MLIDLIPAVCPVILKVLSCLHAVLKKAQYPREKALINKEDEKGTCILITVAE